MSADTNITPEPYYDSKRPGQNEWRSHLHKGRVERRPISLAGIPTNSDKIELFMDQGGQLDITKLLHPDSKDSYRGSGRATALVHFGAMFNPLCDIDYLGDESVWHPETAFRRGIIDLTAQGLEGAGAISSAITALALEAVANSALYDDLNFRDQYAKLTQEGYRLIEQAAEANSMSKAGRLPVVILRAGAPATEYTFGQSYQQLAGLGSVLVPELKRIHLIGEHPGDIAVSLENGTALDSFECLNSADLVICDPALATASSILALCVAACQMGYVPRSVQVRSIAAHRGGVEMLIRALNGMGITTQLLALNTSTYLNSHYYLSEEGGPVVGDAGDALCGTGKQ